MKQSIAWPIFLHEVRLLRHNAMMVFRFGIFYLVFGAVMLRAVMRSEWERLTIASVGLMVLAAVGIAASLAAEAFAHEKERGTMEALLLAPTSAASLLRAKLIYVMAVAACGVAISFTTGPMLVLLTRESANVTYVINRATCVTALLACPPSIVITGSIGSFIACRATSLQSATATASISSMAGMLVVVSIAYLLTTAQPIVVTTATSVTWLAAFIAFRLASSHVRPEIMIRTRGR